VHTESFGFWKSFKLVLDHFDGSVSAETIEQIPYELKTYKRGSDKLAPPELKQVHPLGKSPVITIETPGRSEPLVLAESAAIVEYLCESVLNVERAICPAYVDKVIIMDSAWSHRGIQMAKMVRLATRRSRGYDIVSICIMRKAV
jgi:hypothetical protein